MTDGTERRGDEGHDTAAWWSRLADGTYGAPAGQPSSDPYGPPSGGGSSSGGYAAPQGAPAYSAQGSLEPAYGTPAPNSPAPNSPAPNSPAPSSYGPAYGTPADPYATDGEERRGANAWGYPTTNFGDPAPAAPKQRRAFPRTAAAVLAAALLGGLVGGELVNVTDDDGGSSLTDQSASLGTPSTPQDLDRAPESVAGIAQRVLRSTVSITVRTSSGGGSGSGVVLRSDGYVLTNNHVVEAGESGRITVTVNGSEGRELPASIVGLDPETDLAVIKVEGGGPLVPATLGRSAGLVVGDPVVAIGSPLGLNGTVTTGIISALNRTVNVPSSDGQPATPLLNAIQTDAAINPGNSGGALVDASGAVIGINSAIATLGGSSTGDSGGSIGVGFSIPVDEARSVAEEIIRTGKATHPAIGVEAGNEISDDGRKAGARLTRIVPGGSAAQGGLQVGDVVDKVGDTAVGSVDELILALRQSKVGDRVTLTYVRDGSPRTADVVLGDKATR